MLTPVVPERTHSSTETARATLWAVDGVKTVMHLSQLLLDLARGMLRRGQNAAAETVPQALRI